MVVNGHLENPGAFPQSSLYSIKEYGKTTNLNSLAVVQTEVVWERFNALKSHLKVFAWVCVEELLVVASIICNHFQWHQDWN